jgi:hypothetical protein
LENEFASRRVAYEPGGILLLRAADALALVRRAAEEGLPILGVDGLWLRPTGVQPDLTYVADYSSAVRAGDGCWDAAAAFIAGSETAGLVFEVVLGRDRVPAV